jgi:hypothetical protein
MLPGVQGLKRALNCFLVSTLLGGLVACNSYNNNNPYSPQGISAQRTFPHRVFVSNPLQSNGLGGGSPAINILDATKDVLSFFPISLSSLSSNVTDAGTMAVSPKRDRTLVSSPADGKLAIVNNAQQSVASTVTLAGSTESFFVWTDNATAFVAVPNASVPGQSPGAVEIVDVPNGRVTATIPIPGAHNIVPSPDGNVVLVFSDNSDAVTLLTPSLIGVTGQSNAQVPCSSTQMAACVLPGTFDRPIWAAFSSSGTTAYVMNCGQQCDGPGAGPCLTFTSCTTVSVLDMTQTPPSLGASVPVPAATIGLLQGNNLFVAGTPVSPADNTCAGTTTAATTCGRLTVIDVGSMTAGAPVVITDGYHNKMEMGANAQLFIGSRNCTNVDISGGEMRGCLSIVSTSSGALSASSVTAPPDNGDVTGIAPIPNRNVVYVCEGGKLRIYDTTTDKLEQLTAAPSIVGQAVDVKVVDF